MVRGRGSCADPLPWIRCAQLLKGVTHLHEATVLFHEAVWRNLTPIRHLRKRIEITQQRQHRRLTFSSICLVNIRPDSMLLDCKLDGEANALTPVLGATLNDARDDRGQKADQSPKQTSYRGKEYVYGHRLRSKGFTGVPSRVRERGRSPRWPPFHPVMPQRPPIARPQR